MNRNRKWANVPGVKYPEKEEVFYTRTEVMELLELTPRQYDKLMAYGVLQPVARGLFAKEDIVEIIATREDENVYQSRTFIENAKKV